jgi:hypothetical protein
MSLGAGLGGVAEPGIAGHVNGGHVRVVVAVDEQSGFLVGKPGHASCLEGRSPDFV